MFKLEPIVDSNLDIWGYEALLSLNVPNPYIFAVPNPVLELYLFETFIKTHQEHLKDKRFTFNLSVFAVVIGAENLKKLLKEYPNLYIEVTESAFLPSNPENEWFQLLKKLLEKFPKRFLLDDYMEGKTTFLYQNLKDLWFAVKVSLPILKQIQTTDFNSTLVIAEKIETEEDFSLLKTKANLFQGFYFKSVLPEKFYQNKTTLQID
jgi:c-di-GMP-related signal transduction protein